MRNGKWNGWNVQAAIGYFTTCSCMTCIFITMTQPLLKLVVEYAVDVADRWLRFCPEFYKLVFGVRRVREEWNIKGNFGVK